MDVFTCAASHTRRDKKNTLWYYWSPISPKHPEIATPLSLKSLSLSHLPSLFLFRDRVSHSVTQAGVQWHISAHASTSWAQRDPLPPASPGSWDYRHMPPHKLNFVCLFVCVRNKEFCMLPRLAWNSWVQAVFPPWPPKVLRLQA